MISLHMNIHADRWNVAPARFVASCRKPRPQQQAHCLSNAPWTHRNFCSKTSLIILWILLSVHGAVKLQHACCSGHNFPKEATKQAGLTSPSICQHASRLLSKERTVVRYAERSGKSHHSALCKHVKQDIRLVQIEPFQPLKVCWLSGNGAADTK